MRIIGCDLHARQQTLAMLDTNTGEVVNSGSPSTKATTCESFIRTLPHPVRVGIEATGSMQWFVNLMEELGIECLVGHPAEIRAAEPRKQKHDRRDADLILITSNRRALSGEKYVRVLVEKKKNTLDTAGVVRDSAFIAQVKRCTLGVRNIVPGI